MLRVSIVDDFEKLQALQGDWADLLSKSSALSFALGPDWLLPWWRIFGETGQRALRVGLCHDGQRLLGLAPFLAREHRYHLALPFRRLELLGSGEDERDEICSDYLGVIAAAGAENTVATAFARALADGKFGSWDELLMPALNGFDPLQRLLSAALVRAGVHVERQHANTCPFIPLPQSWDDYLAALAPNARYMVRRSLRDFEKWAAGADRIERASSPEEVEQGTAILRGLHAERWTETREGGAFASPRFANFHGRVMPQLWQKGELELLWLTVSGEPIAALYNVVKNGVVYFYQSGRRLDLPKGIRPGIVLHAHAIRGAIESGRREYDFLAGTSRYKLDLALASRQLITLRATRPSVVETLRSVTQAGLNAARSLRSRLAHAER
jgi:CelD/BcsL family acetyltransferase involved in cellulose biosynthesis